MDRPSVRDLLDQGWYFDYCSDTRFIYCKHPKGGIFSVAEICFTTRFDSDEFGKIMAETLNAVKPKTFGQEDCKHFTGADGCRINYGIGWQRCYCRVGRNNVKCDKQEAL